MYAVLDRVKMFLPQLAQANLELEKQIAGEGSESVVIDSTILAEGGDSDEEVEEEVGQRRCHHILHSYISLACVMLWW